MLGSPRWLELCTLWVNGALTSLCGASSSSGGGSEDYGGSSAPASSYQQGQGQGRNQDQAVALDGTISSAGSAGAAPPLAADAPGTAARVLRFCVMSLWLLLRQWLLDNMSPVNALQARAVQDALYMRSETRCVAAMSALYALKSPHIGGF